MNREEEIKENIKDRNNLLKAISEGKLKNLDEEGLIDTSVYLADELKKTLREVKGLKFEIESLTLKIKQQEDSQNPTNKYSNYPKDSDYISKLLFILSKKEPDINFEDIVNAFFYVEPDLDEKWRNPRKSISKIISRACGFKVIIRKKIFGDNGCYTYTLANKY